MQFIKQMSCAVAFFIILLFSSLASAQLINGNTLFERMVEYDKNERGDPDFDQFGCIFYMGYVEGIYDLMVDSFNDPKNVTVGQILSIVGKYLKDNPEKRHLPASFLVMDALRNAFPKR